MNHSIFKDLVPSYLEKLTSEETNKQIEIHLEQCEYCRQYLQEMQQDVMVEYQGAQKKDKKSIDVFKKVRAKNRKNIFVTIGALLTIFTGCFFFLTSMWIANEEAIQTTITQQGKSVTLSFQTKNSNRYLLPMRQSVQDDNDEVIIYEKWYDFSAAAKLLKDKSQITYLFLDENTLLLGNGEQKKLTAQDKIKIRYKNSVEEIALKNLYNGEKSK